MEQGKVHHDGPPNNGGRRDKRGLSQRFNNPRDFQQHAHAMYLPRFPFNSIGTAAGDNIGNSVRAVLLAI